MLPNDYTANFTDAQKLAVAKYDLLIDHLPELTVKDQLRKYFLLMIHTETVFNHFIRGRYQTLDSPATCSLEQKFTIAVMEKDIDKMSLNEAKEFAKEGYRLHIGKNNAYHSVITM